MGRPVPRRSGRRPGRSVDPPRSDGQRTGFDGYPVRPYGPARDRWRAVGTAGRCHHRDVSVRPDNDGREPGVPGSASSATPVGGPSLFRGLLRQTGEPLAAEPVAPSSVARPLEVELAERLDSVLAIAERLAESHDQQELFRTIVDETMRALRADATTIRILRDDRLEVTAWAGMPDEVAMRMPVFRRDEGWVGDMLSGGHAIAYRDVRVATAYGSERYDGIFEVAGHLTAPLIHHDRVIGAL